MELLKRPILFLFLIGLVGLGGCAEKFPEVLQEGRPQQRVLSSVLEGQFSDLQGRTLKLDSETIRPTVLVFASEFCELCSKETLEWVAALPDPTRAPSNVRIITIVAGATQADAQTWLEVHKVPWEVGIDSPDLTLMKSYCPKISTPCVIVHRPEQGIVFRNLGAVSAAQLQQLTGAWE